MSDDRRNFVRAILCRAARTVCQAALASIGSATLISAVDWKVVLSTSLLAGIVSVLTSLSLGIPEA